MIFSKKCARCAGAAIMTKNKERAVMNFIAKYVSDEMRGFFSGGGYDLEYIDYDWSLNGQEVAP
jgi:hypothetical protein